MSLKSDLQKLVKSATDLVAELPATQERRGLEISFGKVKAALEKISDKDTMEDVKEAVAKKSAKTEPKIDKELVPLGSTTPFSEEDQKKIYKNQQPEGKAKKRSSKNK